MHCKKTIWLFFWLFFMTLMPLTFATVVLDGISGTGGTLPYANFLIEAKSSLPFLTWWAYAFYAITVLALIVIYVRLQIQKRNLREKQQELERLLEKQQELEEMVAQLTEANRLKDEFLANISHELRTPISGMIGIAESLIDGATGRLSELTNENLSMIGYSGHCLLHLVSDITDFSLLKKKEISLQLTTVDSRTIAEVVLALHQPLLVRKKVQMINAIPPNLPAISADENRVQQILYNLVNNAIKFTDSGTIKISADIVKGERGSLQRENEKDSNLVHNLQFAAKVFWAQKKPKTLVANTIRNSQLENWLAITVSDTGTGIPADKLDQIFEAFEKTDGSMLEVYGGTGLRLAVTQQLVKLHGGQLYIQSQAGVGSQFTFTLPISEAQAEKMAPPLSGHFLIDTQPSLNVGTALPLSEMSANAFEKAEVSTETPPEDVTTDKNGEFILVVDDDPVNRQILINYLSLRNYIVTQAASGAEVLTLIETGYKPDLILLDVMMPGMSGYEVTRKIREKWQADELPIILLTATNRVADLVVGLESGANDYLTKPVSKDELLARINTHLHILQLKAETLQNEKRLRQFLEAMPVGIAVLDAQSKLYYINQKAQQLLGKGMVEVTHEQVPEFYQIYVAGTNQLYPPEELLGARALRGESITADNMEIHQGDKIIPIEVWGTPLFDDDGNITYTLAVFQDTTERKMAMEAQERFTQELSELNKAYERFVPREFLSLLDKQNILDVNLGDQVEKEITVLFTDIREFTAISEGMTPQDIFEFINAYLGQMEPVILEHHGIIDKYIGDAIMVLFPTSANDAVNGAIAMLKKLAQYNQLLQRAGFKSLQIGIGLNTGPLMLGTVGGQHRMEGTVIADAVNLASRIEGLTKIYNTPLLITEQTYLNLDDPLQYNIRVIDAVKVKGKSSVITIYEIYDADPPDILALKDETRDDFEQGFVLYHWEEYVDAQPFFKQVLQINQKDQAAQVYLDRCQKILSMAMPASPAILIVEDDSVNMQTLSDFLTKNHLKVSAVQSGEAALQAVQDERPHLILLDIMMPDMDGFETCRRLKANSKTQNLPIIFITALSDTVDQIKGFELGAVDFITKPFQQQEVLARIKTHLRLSHLQQQLQARTDELEVNYLELKKKINRLRTPVGSKQ